MSRAPDLSAFPIPRKGGARPIIGDETEEARGEGGDPRPRTESANEGAGPHPGPEPEPVVTAPRQLPAASGGGGTSPRTTGQAIRVPPPPPPQSYGQTVATTVKLDENRYLRLVEAGKPGPGRLRRRTIQDMLIEALDEWFERRQL
jgi:hypothetical protein